MYELLGWKDEVRNPDHLVKLEDQGDGIHKWSLAGTQMQQGVNMSGPNFAHMDEGILSAHIALNLLFTYISAKLGFSDESMDGLRAALDGEIAKIVSGDTIAKKASQLENARTIALSGGATGTATNFNGSANITIPVTSLDATKLSGKVAIGNGGTNATDAAGARANLSVPSIADLNAAAILDNAMMCVNQAAQRALDVRLTTAEAQLAAINT